MQQWISQPRARIWIIAGILIVVVLGAVIVRVVTQPTYLWHDEFDSAHLDTTKWTPLQGGDFYTPPTLEDYSTAAIALQNGQLTLTSQRQDSEGFQYTSGGVSSKGKYALRYGIITWQFQLPRGDNGLWPAIWMLPEDGSGSFELDAMEYYSTDPHTLLMTNHYVDAQKQQQFTATPYTGTDFSASAHSLKLDWEPTSVQWVLDGKVVKTLRDHIPNVPMFIYMNTAVGGLGGTPDPDTFKTAQFRIDYVRVSPMTAKSMTADARGSSLADAFAGQVAAMPRRVVLGWLA